MRVILLSGLFGSRAFDRQHAVGESSVGFDEVAAMRDRERKRRVQALFAKSDDTITLTEEVFRRAAGLMKKGFGAADALHVASSERLDADVLLTCDDRLIRLGRRNRKVLRVAILDPVTWLGEVSDASNLE